MADVDLYQRNFIIEGVNGFDFVQEEEDSGDVTLQMKDGPVKIYLCVIPRRKLKLVLNMIERINPNSFITTDMANPTSLKKCLLEYHSLSCSCPSLLCLTFPQHEVVKAD